MKFSFGQQKSSPENPQKLSAKEILQKMLGPKDTQKSLQNQMRNQLKTNLQTKESQSFTISENAVLQQQLQQEEQIQKIEMATKKLPFKIHIPIKDCVQQENSALNSQNQIQSTNNKLLTQPESKPKQEHFINISPKESIKFPYMPYRFQEDSVKLMSLYLSQDSPYILFESPTGTGKTQTILSSVLHSISKSKSKQKVLYFTWTTAQMNQVLREAKLCNPDLMGLVITSKKRLCIHSEKPLKGTEHFCREKIKHNFCQYNGGSLKQTSSQMAEEKIMLDIEDLLRLGRESYSCPYYLSWNLINNADLLVLSYQYIFSSACWQTIYSHIKDSIVVFDEAHNIINNLEETGSYRVNIGALWDIYQKIEELDLSKVVQEKKKENNQNSQSAAINSVLLQRLWQTQQELLGYIQELCIGITNYQQQKQFLQKEEISEFLKLNDISLYSLIVFSKETDKFLQSEDCFQFIQSFVFYKKAFQNKENLKSFFLTVEQNQIMRIICCDSKLIFNEIVELKPKTVIFASGTLQPFEHLETQLSTQFEKKIVSWPDQSIFSKTIKLHILKSLFHFNHNQSIVYDYKNKNELSSYKGLIQLIFQLKSFEKGGILIFLSSYQQLEVFQSAYKDSMLNNHLVFFEQRNSDNQKQFQKFTVISQYKVAYFLMVIGGKFSEGIDFKDHLCWQLFIIGIPFDNIQSPEVQAKRQQFIEAPEKFENWYGHNAFLKVNQAIGRVKRHVDDYGSIVLIDNRFSYRKYLERISNQFWVLASYPNDFFQIQNDLQEFFKEQAKIEEELKLIQEQKNKFRIEDQEHCYICYEYFNKEEFLTAKCGHSACWNCWGNLLKEKLECMICKEKVRPQNLKRVS